ncbi:hypothetical protein ABIA00_002498 [Bradyrhizobium ottawaense]|uniref:hypothetical protein n=1 Tax=Bradyrhizobium ottawaense TaxID=931866 RepID=UPI00383340E0
MIGKKREDEGERGRDKLSAGKASQEQTKAEDPAKPEESPLAEEPQQGVPPHGD